ncbi:MAG: carbohydrate porin [Cyanobacteria bacterium J06635_10]
MAKIFTYTLIGVMKSKILECEKLTLIKEFHKQKPFFLLCAISISVLSTLGASDRSAAQMISPTDRQSWYSGNLLRVPQSSIPSGRTKQPLQKMPPPPNASYIDAALSSLKVEQYLPLDNIKQLENSFIQEQITSKTKGGIEQSRGIGRKTKPIGGPSGTYEVKQINAQAVPLPPPPGSSQEFASPIAPTLNQNFNSQIPIAPLPPLPGTNLQQKSNANNAPTFNQLLNSRTTYSSQYPKSLPPNNGPTFQQMLDAYRRQAPVSVTSTPTFNTLLNSQGGIRPSVPLTTSQQLGTTPMMPAPSPSTAQLTPQNINELQPLRSSAALRESSLRVEGVYVTQGDDTSARGRITGIYPLSSQVLFGGTLDLTSEGSSFDDSRREGLNINELYLATSISGLPNLRVAVGQLDLTSYFDRNTFAKDGASQFFNPVFQTNPALAATGIASRTGLLVNWSVTDNIDTKAAIFSSSDSLSEFSLDGFAGEIGVRYGNAIIRGTYSNNRDAGNNDTFSESFQINRGNDEFGVLEDDREEAYGVSAEVFIPKMKLGLFGRYGRYENRDLGEGADTYLIGASFLDIFSPDDRLGLAYGRDLSNDELREGNQPDVLELYYDFQFLPNLRLGFSVQGRDEFEETVLGVRVKSDFDVTPRGRFAR